MSCYHLKYILALISSWYLHLGKHGHLMTDNRNRKLKLMRTVSLTTLWDTEDHSDVTAVDLFDQRTNRLQNEILTGFTRWRWLALKESQWYFCFFFLSSHSLVSSSQLRIWGSHWHKLGSNIEMYMWSTNIAPSTSSTTYSTLIWNTYQITYTSFKYSQASNLNGLLSHSLKNAPINAMQVQEEATKLWKKNLA